MILRELELLFSNGVDAEYAVIGRVAVGSEPAMKRLYGAGERSQS